MTNTTIDEMPTGMVAMHTERCLACSGAGSVPAAPTGSRVKSLTVTCLICKGAKFLLRPGLA